MSFPPQLGRRSPHPERRPPSSSGVHGREEEAEEASEECDSLVGEEEAAAQSWGRAPLSLADHLCRWPLLAAPLLGVGLLLLLLLLSGRGTEWAPVVLLPSGSARSPLQSDSRGYVAVMYSGSPRAFSRVFRSHLVNLFAGSPYSVHVYVHTFAAEFRAATGAHPRYHSINDTLRYFDSFINLDGQRVRLMDDCLQGFELDRSSLDDIRRLYGRQLRYVLEHGAWRHEQPADFEAATLLAMLHSQWRANELRRAYMHRTGVEYRWVLRMRMDLLLRTNVWDAVFDRSPLEPLLAEHHQLRGAGAEAVRARPDRRAPARRGVPRARQSFRVSAAQRTARLPPPRLERPVGAVQLHRPRRLRCPPAHERHPGPVRGGAQLHVGCGDEPSPGARAPLHPRPAQRPPLLLRRARPSTGGCGGQGRGCGAPPSRRLRAALHLHSVDSVRPGHVRHRRLPRGLPRSAPAGGAGDDGHPPPPYRSGRRLPARPTVGRRSAPSSPPSPAARTCRGPPPSAPTPRWSARTRSRRRCRRRCCRCTCRRRETSLQTRSRLTSPSTTRPSTRTWRCPARGRRPRRCRAHWRWTPTHTTAFPSSPPPATLWWWAATFSRPRAGRRRRWSPTARSCGSDDDGRAPSADLLRASRVRPVHLLSDVGVLPPPSPALAQVGHSCVTVRAEVRRGARHPKRVVAVARRDGPAVAAWQRKGPSERERSCTEAGDTEARKSGALREEEKSGEG